MRPRHLRQELDPARLVPNLTAGFISGAIAMVVSISFAALIFSGPLADRVGNGIGLMSSFPISLAGPQDSPAAILALVAAALVSSMATALNHEAMYATVVTAIALTSLLTGTFFLALGRFKLGRLSFLALDFRRVNGVDSSAVSSFVRLKQLAEANQVRLVFTHLSAEMVHQLVKAVFTANDPVLQVFPALDYGIEWYEAQVLTAKRTNTIDLPDTLAAQFAAAFPTAAHMERFRGYLEKEEVATGYYLFRHSEPSGCIYFLATGAATAHFELLDGRSIRLSAMRAGTMLGGSG